MKGDRRKTNLVCSRIIRTATQSWVTDRDTIRNDDVNDGGAADVDDGIGWWLI